jgi:hypothetical protein
VRQPLDIEFLVEVISLKSDIARFHSKGHTNQRGALAQNFIANFLEFDSCFVDFKAKPLVCVSVVFDLLLPNLI